MFSWFHPINEKNILTWKNQKNLKALLKALSYKKDNRIRKAAIIAIGEVGNSLIAPELLKVLQDAPEPELRYEALNSLENIADKELLIEGIRIGLKDRKKIIRLRSVQILKRKNIDINKEIAQYLIELLNDPYEDLRNQALEVFINIKDRDITTLLIECLNNKDWKVRVKLLNILGESDFKSMIISPIIKMFNDSSKEVRDKVAESLIKIGPPAIPVLKKALKTETKAIQSSIINVLNDMGFCPDNKQEMAQCLFLSRSWDELGRMKSTAAIKVLSQALKGEDKFIRKKALETLLNKGNQPGVKETLVKALRNRDREIRWIASQALIDMGWTASLDIDKAYFYYATGEWEKVYSLNLPEAKKLIIRALDNNDRNIRARAIEIIAEFRDVSALESLKQRILHDKDISIRYQVIKSMETIDFADTINSIFEMLKSDNPLLRRKGMEVITYIEDKKAVPHLINALHEKDYFIREKAAEVLSTNFKENKLAVNALIYMLSLEKNYFVLKGIINGLGRAGDMEALKPLEYILKDEKQARSIINYAGNAIILIGTNSIQLLSDVIKRANIVTVKKEAEKALINLLKNYNIEGRRLNLGDFSDKNLKFWNRLGIVDENLIQKIRMNCTKDIVIFFEEYDKPQKKDIEIIKP